MWRPIFARYKVMFYNSIQDEALLAYEDVYIGRVQAFFVKIFRFSSFWSWGCIINCLVVYDTRCRSSIVRRFDIECKIILSLGLILSVSLILSICLRVGTFWAELIPWLIKFLEWDCVSYQLIKSRDDDISKRLFIIRPRTSFSRD